MDDNRITVRLGVELMNNIDIMSNATNTNKAQVIRAILKKFFEDNEDLLDEYYANIKDK